MRFSKSTGRMLAAIATVIMIVATVGQIGYVQSATSLQVTHDTDTNRIFVRGSGASPEVATVHLRLDAPDPQDHIDADVILVIDRSASFPVSQAVSHAKRIIDRLGPNDRVGVVSFATEATLDAPLTYANDADSVIEALDDLRDEGRTAMGEGMALATDELDFSGRSNVDWIQILLTDGRSNHGRSPVEQADNASDLGVVVYAVGVGTSVNHSLLEEVSESTGGRFYSTYSDAIVNDILSVDFNDRAPVATDVEVSVTLTRDFNYETAIDNPPDQQINNVDGTLTLRWLINEIDRDETWVARYTVSSNEVNSNARINDDRSEVRYTDARGRDTVEEIPELSIDVRPTPPPTIAEFDYEPKNPTTFDAIEFSENSRIDGPGEIESYFWEFGDDTTSTEQNPTHRYSADGDYQVKLTIRTNEFVEATMIQDIKVSTPQVSVRREINTYLPVARTILGQSLEVTLKIRVNDTVNGLGIEELLPVGWAFSSDNDEDVGGEISYLSGTNTVGSSGTTSVAFEQSTLGTSASVEMALQWLFQGILEPGTEIHIVYQVDINSAGLANAPAAVGNATPPSFTGPATTGNKSITGTAISASPGFTTPIQGGPSISIQDGFDIEIVVAHWSGSATDGTLALEDYPSHMITKDQLDVARDWWADPPSLIPFTKEGEAVDLKVITCLTAYYVTGISVFEPLPESQAGACDADD